MSTKIRLARHGRKGRPFYHVVIADSRAPRDGRYIEKIGTYNPNTNPATIDLKFDRALYWLMTGAQPTDTASRILSYKGVLLKKHLLEGVKKGAFDEAAAEAKFEAWMKEKEAKIQAKIQKLAQAGDAAAKAALEAEAKVRAAKEEIIAKKKAELAAAEAAKKAEEEAAAAGPTEVTLILKSCGAAKVKVIKAVQAITGLGLIDAKKLVDNCPATIKEHISPAEAEGHKATLVEAGAEVEVK